MEHKMIDKIMQMSVVKMNDISLLQNEESKLNKKELSEMTSSFEKLGLFLNPLILCRNGEEAQSYTLIGRKREYTVAKKTSVKLVNAFIFENMEDAKEACRSQKIEIEIEIEVSPKDKQQAEEKLLKILNNGACEELRALKIGIGPKMVSQIIEKRSFSSLGDVEEKVSKKRVSLWLKNAIRKEIFVGHKEEALQKPTFVQGITIENREKALFVINEQTSTIADVEAAIEYLKGCKYELCYDGEEEIQRERDIQTGQFRLQDFEKGLTPGTHKEEAKRNAKTEFNRMKKEAEQIHQAKMDIINTNKNLEYLALEKDILNATNDREISNLLKSSYQTFFNKELEAEQKSYFVAVEKEEPLGPNCRDIIENIIDSYCQENTEYRKVDDEFGGFDVEEFYNGNQAAKLIIKLCHYSDSTEETIQKMYYPIFQNFVEKLGFVQPGFDKTPLGSDQSLYMKRLKKLKPSFVEKISKIRDLVVQIDENSIDAGVKECMERFVDNYEQCVPSDSVKAKWHADSFFSPYTHLCSSVEEWLEWEKRERLGMIHRKRVDNIWQKVVELVEETGVVPFNPSEF